MAFSTKATKDLRQSVALITYYAKHQPEDLTEAWTDLYSRGKGWRSRFDKGVDMLLRELPEVEPALIWRENSAPT
jgi:hypothetical protein